MPGCGYESPAAIRLVAMKPPISFDADEIRNKRVDVLGGRPFHADEIHRFAVRDDRNGIMLASNPAWLQRTGRCPESVPNMRPRTEYRQLARAGVPFTGALAIKPYLRHINFRLPHQCFPLRWRVGNRTD